MVEIFQYRRNMLKLLALCLLISLVYVQIAEARIRHYKWEVKYEYKSPDCYKKLAMTINGRTPGPTILAQQGDTIIVEVKNSLMLENLAIHWHGIRQVNTAQFPFSFLNLQIHIFVFILLFDFCCRLDHLGVMEQRG
jgi:FtsP/CotA-like multicopper oxidase with cupredoxin domain